MTAITTRVLTVRRVWMALKTSHAVACLGILVNDAKLVRSVLQFRIWEGFHCFFIIKPAIGASLNLLINSQYAVIDENTFDDCILNFHQLCFLI